MATDKWDWWMNINNTPYRPPVYLDRDVTYRFELKVERTDTDAANFDIRIYSRDGAGDESLVYTGADIILHFSPNTPLYDGNPYSMGGNVAQLADLLNFGVNGWDGGGSPTFDLYYQGCFAVRTDDWCGKYDSAEASF